MGCTGSADRSEQLDVVVVECRSSKPRRISNVHKQHLLERKLGEGAFGVVYAATHLDSDRGAAVKVLDLRPEVVGEKAAFRAMEAAQREIAMLKSLPASPHIVQVVGWQNDGDLAYMVMENGGVRLLHALEALPELTESVLQQVFKEMLAGVTACHAVGIVHRDVKPENFLAAMGCKAAAQPFMVKLCDFGLSGRVVAPGARDLQDVVGSPPFMAPEMVARQPYGTKVDVWALGVVAYVLLFGEWPYMPKERSGAAMQEAIRDDAPPIPFRSGGGLPELSGTCAAWVKELLHRDADRRPSAAEAAELPSMCAAWRGRGGVDEAAEPAPSLQPTLRAACRLGAFATGRSDQRARAALEAELSRRNAWYHKGRRAPSEASTISTAQGADEDAAHTQARQGWQSP